MTKQSQQPQTISILNWKNIRVFIGVTLLLLIALTLLQFLIYTTLFNNVVTSVFLIIGILQLFTGILKNFFTKQVPANQLNNSKSSSRLITITKRASPFFAGLIIISYILYTFAFPHTKVVTHTKFIPHPLVTSTANSGPGSLRQVYSDALKGDTIQFSPKLKGQTLIITTNLILNKDIKFLGMGKELTDTSVTLSSPQENFKSDITISNHSNAQIYIMPEVNVSFENINLSNAVTQNGAFINNAGVMDFFHDAIEGNLSQNNGNGGVLANTGSLTIRDSYLSTNTSLNDGGGIYNLGGLLILYHTTLFKNTAEHGGGGIYNEEGVVNIVNYSSIEENQVKAGDGGGIESRSGLVVISNNSDIQDNTTKGDGGGLMIAGGQAQLESIVINHNTADRRGGGMAVEINTDDGNTGLVTIHNQDFQTNWLGDRDSSSPYANIWGNSTILGNNDQLISGKDTGKQGEHYQPTQNPQFLGAISANQFNDFCKNYNNVNAYTGASLSTTAFAIACITNQGEKKLLTDLMPSDTYQRACSSIFKDKLQRDHVSTSNVIARLGNNDNPLSWQCFEKENRLGNITTDLVNANTTKLDDYCQSQGYEKAIKIADTHPNVYDWECYSINKNDGIYMSEACTHEYNNLNAVDIITDFSKPESWECWGP